LAVRFALIFGALGISGMPFLKKRVSTFQKHSSPKGYWACANAKCKVLDFQRCENSCAIFMKPSFNISKNRFPQKATGHVTIRNVRCWISKGAQIIMPFLRNRVSTFRKTNFPERQLGM
jgi:hypothetical protein